MLHKPTLHLENQIQRLLDRIPGWKPCQDRHDMSGSEKNYGLENEARAVIKIKEDKQ